MSDDDREVLARLAALEAEVKAEVDAKRKESDAKEAERQAMLARIRAEKERRAALKAATEPKPAPAAKTPAPAPKPVARAEPPPEAALVKAPPKRKRPPTPEPEVEDLGFEEKADMMMTVAKGARMAHQAKAELAKPREKGDKSWLISGGASFLFGPLGWLYAGSFREAIPASFLYLLLAALLTKLPVFLVYPALMVALPLSAIAGIVYSMQYNRHGSRQRLFDKDDKKALPAASPKKLRRGD